MIDEGPGCVRPVSACRLLEMLLDLECYVDKQRTTTL